MYCLLVCAHACFCPSQTQEHRTHGTYYFLQDLTCGGLVPAVVGCLDAFVSPGFLKYLALDSEEARATSGSTGNQTLSSLWRFAVALAGELAVTQAAYYVPPRSFIRLLCDGEEKTEALRELRRLCSFYAVRV